MFLIALFVAHLIAAATGATTNQFINPGPQNFNLQQVDGTYPIGSAINIQWETIYNTVTLVIWQNGPLTFQYLPNSLGLANSTTSFTWTVNLSGTGGNPNFTLSAGETFFFGLFETGTTNVFESQYINITSNAVASSSSSTSAAARASSASETATNSPLSSTLVSSTSTSTSTPSPSSQAAKGGLSTTAKTGLGVGLGVGIVALVAGLGTGYFMHRRKKKTSAAGVPFMAEHSPYGPDGKQVLQGPQELPPTQDEHPRIYEL